MSHHTNEELRAELKSLADTLESVLNTAESKSKEDNYVRENPWTGVGIGAAVGVVLGVLLARR